MLSNVKIGDAYQFYPGLTTLPGYKSGQTNKHTNKQTHIQVRAD